jgi:hypothetical protein
MNNIVGALNVFLIAAILVGAALALRTPTPARPHHDLASLSVENLRTGAVGQLPLSGDHTLIFVFSPACRVATDALHEIAAQIGSGGWPEIRLLMIAFREEAESSLGAILAELHDAEVYVADAEHIEAAVGPTVPAFILRAGSGVAYRQTGYYGVDRLLDSLRVRLRTIGNES